MLLVGAAGGACGEVMIPGLSTSRLEPAMRGLVLMEELNCVACHSSEGEFAGRSKKAPRLAKVGSRLHPEYIERFIRDPAATDPGTTMPHALARLPEKERDEAARALRDFLLSLERPEFALEPPDGVAAAEGAKVFHARGCAACHSPRDSRGAEVLPLSSAPLGRMETKYGFRSLVDFLREPLAVRPSGRMPEVPLDGREREQIAHYLLRETRVPGTLAFTLYRGRVWEGLESEEVEGERAGHAADFSLKSLGAVHHHMAVVYDCWLRVTRKGKHAFFGRMNGGSLVVDDQEVWNQAPSDRRGVKSLEGAAELQEGWRRLKVTYFHTGHDPEFALEMSEPGGTRQPIPGTRLSVSKEPIPALVLPRPDETRVAHGRVLFGKLGCVQCHDDVEVPRPTAPEWAAPAWAALDAARGCLSEETGAGFRFDLSAEQRALVAQALPAVEAQRLDDEPWLAKTLVTFNCIGCHERAGLGGIAPERNALFTGTRPALGDQGRLPPPLTHVGAKLTPEWLTAVLVHGGRQRGYLDTRMPRFGESNVGSLVRAFGVVDSLEAVELPKIANLRESRDAGYEMVGAGGFSCIACHDFNGQPSGGAGALDLVHVTERVQKDWFHLYMRQPSRFHPTVIMPSYWPGGQSLRPTLLGGDTARQIEALWTYLEDGPKARKPLGLSRQSNELRVADVAEICRGRGPAGYRGMAVGYPLRLNLAFDTEEMALRLLWKGEFANVEMGGFQPRGDERLEFPPGIPFHRLKSLDDAWPYKGRTDHPFPQDHGYQFRGYRLDAQRRPTLRYQFGSVAVEDFFEDVRAAEGAVFLRRTLRFEAEREEAEFFFRAACGKSVAAVSDRVFKLDALEVRVLGENTGRLRAGDPGELLIPLRPRPGISTLTLEYQW